jgi:translation initiation factor 2B subunit (eIF-2B alpha/beta/delta family)
MDDGWPTVLALAEDHDSGAAEITREAAGALARLRRRRVPEAIELLLRAHPSMAPLWRLGSEALWAQKGYREGMHRFIRVLDRDAQAAEELGLALPATVLTISWSSAVAAAIVKREPDRVVCMLSEPGGEGRQMAEAVADAAGTVVVMDDREALETLPADAVVVGADAVTPAGVVNKVGTAALAAAAAASSRKIPRYAVAGDTKLVADDVPIVGPFESTPLDLFTAIVTPEGPLTPAEARHLARSHPIHPDLTPLLIELGGGKG